MSYNEKYVDLHIHTIYSDGSLTPTEAISYAKNRNIVVIGITDHDTTDSVKEAIAVAKDYGIEIVSGVELAAEFKDSPEEEIHILGYFIDYNNENLQQQLKIFRNARQQRAEQIFNKLSHLGLNLDKQEIFKSQSIGRLHFARILLKKGMVSNIKEAFEKYLGYGKPAYVPKLKLKTQQAISIILQAGGIPVLAHPYANGYIDVNSIKKLIDQGVKGIEVYHPKHHKNAIEELLIIAEKYDLLITGGSDCHGSLDSNNPTIGSLRLPYDMFLRLKEYKEQVLMKQ